MSEHKRSERLQARSIAIVWTEAEPGELSAERTAVPYPPVRTASRGAAADEYDSDAAGPKTYEQSVTIADEPSVAGADRLRRRDRPIDYGPPPPRCPLVDVEYIVTRLAGILRADLPQAVTNAVRQEMQLQNVFQLRELEVAGRQTTTQRDHRTYPNSTTINQERHRLLNEVRGNHIGDGGVSMPDSRGVREERPLLADRSYPNHGGGDCEPPRCSNYQQRSRQDTAMQYLL